MTVYCGIIKTQTIMKKYILNLFPNREKQPEEVFELAMLIGLYNFEEPENEFINWLINNLSGQYFIFYPIGNLTNKDVSPHRYDIQFSNESKRVGTIQVVDTES